MIKPIQFAGGLADLPLKDGAKFENQIGDEFTALLAKFFVCDQCRVVFLFDGDPPKTCPVCS